MRNQKNWNGEITCWCKTWDFRLERLKCSAVGRENERCEWFFRLEFSFFHWSEGKHADASKDSDCVRKLPKSRRKYLQKRRYHPTEMRFLPTVGNRSLQEFKSFRLDKVFKFQSESSVKSGPGCSDYSDICSFQSETVLYGRNKEHFLPDEALSISQENVKI